MKRMSKTGYEQVFDNDKIADIIDMALMNGDEAAIMAYDVDPEMVTEMVDDYQYEQGRLEAMEDHYLDASYEDYYDDDRAYLGFEDDGEALSSMGWGTDEDYGHFGGDDL